MTLHYVFGCTETEVAAYFKMWRGIGLPATRRILREGRAMIKLLFEGRDLRKVFPARYSRDGSKSAIHEKRRIPPPPLSRHTK